MRKYNIKITVAIVGTILMVTVLKLTLPQPYINLTSEQEYWIKKTFSKNLKNIVIGGDSRVYRGISPATLIKSTELPLSAINLGYSSGSFSKEYLQFMHDRLDSNSNTRVMVLGITPNSLLKSQLSNNHLKSVQNKSSSEIFHGMHYAKFLKHFSPYTVYELLDDSSNAYTIDYRPDGFAASNNYNGDFDLTHYLYWDGYKKETVQEEQINNLVNHLSIFKKEGIQIFAYVPPTTQKMREIENQMSGLDMNKLQQKLESIGVHWIDINLENYTSYDGSHLFSESAERLSKRIGEEISPILTRKK